VRARIKAGRQTRILGLNAATAVMRGMHVRRARAPAPHLRPGSVLLLLLLACAATCVAAVPEAVATCGAGACARRACPRATAKQRPQWFGVLPTPHFVVAGAQEGGAALQALMAEANERLLQLGQVLPRVRLSPPAGAFCVDALCFFLRRHNAGVRRGGPAAAHILQPGAPTRCGAFGCLDGAAPKLHACFM
jgi:hypothetical protein